MILMKDNKYKDNKYKNGKWEQYMPVQTKKFMEDSNIFTWNSPPKAKNLEGLSRVKGLEAI